MTFFGVGLFSVCGVFFFPPPVIKNDSTAIISIISSFSQMHSKGREVYGEAGKTEEKENRKIVTR